MKDIKVKDIVIIGGGTSGWMAALFLLKREGYNITVIESKKIPTIGVGESTQPSVSAFFEFAGYKQTDWMPKCKATYK